MLGLSWGVDLEIKTLNFRAEGHNTNFDSDDAVGISFDSGVSWSSYALAATSGTVNFVGKIVKAGDLLLISTTAEPRYEQFYLGSAIVS